MYNLSRFNLISIRLAVACAQHGSLTSAAREQHIALAAASRRIRELESALGQALFDRHGKGLSTTQAGRVFVRHAVVMLQALDQLSIELSDQQQGFQRHIRLSASTAAINQFLPPLLASYTRLRPRVRVDLDEQVSDSVVLALREGRADLGIFVEGPDIDGLETSHFRSDELVLVLPSGHLLAGPRKPLQFADTLDEDIISLSAGAAMLQKQQGVALAANKPLKLRFQVRSFDAVCHLVASGMGIAVLPRAAALPLMRSMKLVARPLADPWAHRNILIGQLKRVQDPDIEALVRHLIAPSEVANAGRPKPSMVPEARTARTSPMTDNKAKRERQNTGTR
jgi:DNA-binding transcriptional LysR family regulator